MEFSYRNNHVRLGIANSIASKNNFDWLTTIRYAKELALSLIQFYISQKELASSFQEIRFRWNFDTNAFFHLAKGADSRQLEDSFRFITGLSVHPVILSHEVDINKEVLKKFTSSNGIFAIENDTSDRLNLNTYFNLIQQLPSIIKSNRIYFAVLDIPRFFNQYASHFSIEEISETIKNTLKYVQRNNIPIIFHMIDVKSVSAGREDWTALFQGCLPWDEILSYALSIRCPIKAFIMEYEDFSLTRESIYNLKKWSLRNNLLLR